jgi:hypothetical protein
MLIKEKKKVKSNTIGVTQWLIGYAVLSFTIICQRLKESSGACREQKRSVPLHINVSVLSH